MRKELRVKLERTDDKMTTAFLRIPFDVEKEYGAKRVPVRGTINGVEYRSTIACAPKLGLYAIPVCRELRERIGVEVGDTVTWVIERDVAERTVDPPQELVRIFRTNSAAKQTWEKLCFTHKKEFARWIEGAKKPETRERRIAKTLEMLAAGEKPHF